MMHDTADKNQNNLHYHSPMQRLYVVHAIIKNIFLDITVIIVYCNRLIPIEHVFFIFIFIFTFALPSSVNVTLIIVRTMIIRFSE